MSLNQCRGYRENENKIKKLTKTDWAFAVRTAGEGYPQLIVNRVNMRSMQSAILFYQFRPSLRLSVVVMYLNECIYRQTLFTVCFPPTA